MVRRRVKASLAIATLFAVGLLAFWALLRFVHHTPLVTSRAVEFAGGRFVLEVPRQWAIGYDTEPPHSLLISHIRLPIHANLTLVDELGGTARDGLAVLHALGIKQAEDIGDGRAAASLPRVGDELGAVHHLARVDPDGRVMRMQLEVGWARGATWLPSVAADADFIRDSIRRAALNSDQDIARKEYDEWAPARLALQAIEADFQLSYDVLLWAFGAFLVVWCISHVVFEKCMRLGKIGYTWVGQATTVISFLGLLLAGAALVSNRMEHRAKLAEAVTVQAASAAVFHMREQASICADGWDVTIKLHPVIHNSKPVTIDCKRFRSVMVRLAQHIDYARTQIVKQGDFVDPGWVLGMPISMYIGVGDRIIAGAELSDDQYEALSNRYMFFMEPLEQALRVVQKQSDYLASANAFKQIAHLWTVCLAASLALAMVKLTGDRRIEREKIAGDKSSAPVAPALKDEHAATSTAAEQHTPTPPPPSAAAEAPDCPPPTETPREQVKEEAHGRNESPDASRPHRAAD